jgi:hypothetical protein
MKFLREMKTDDLGPILRLKLKWEYDDRFARRVTERYHFGPADRAIFAKAYPKLEAAMRANLGCDDDFDPTKETP